MYLWRPTQNNQRYAYSALENGDEEEEEFEVRSSIPFPVVFDCKFTHCQHYVCRRLCPTFSKML
jgi:hypothetical protein